ncbi:hypothetical protein [Manganibacter manganicus]|uniref:Uncharacterized protein n=1 Tax=Manganibacter manganicus TaxID=1873176 RepID=A0A1V8RP55_9HYPH|nr:hypothetical protein [Pseudaminobacter manganicus]OQM74924.1 hypothetical protein BFN67_04735 [Pseudaminobacter manganicus]
MSLEQTIAENTAAIKELIAITKQSNELRTEAMDKIAATATATKAAPKKETAKEEAKPQISTSPEDRKENPYEGIKEAIAGYITGTDRPEERDARKTKVKALLNHEKIKKEGVADATSTDHIREESIDLFMKNLNALKDKGDLTSPKADSDDLV